MQDPLAHPLEFFSAYLRLTGVAHLGPEKGGDPRLLGKRLGLLNGSAWIMLWSTYFGRLYLPGVHLVSMGNEAIQLSFMEAYHSGKPHPPQSNIDCFVRYAKDLVELAGVHAVLITCSTMNRSYPAVDAALRPHGVPVVQIDVPIMEEAVRRGGAVLVVATHGPTVASTQSLLEETAARLRTEITYHGISCERAWDALAQGDVEGHNQALATTIRKELDRASYSTIVLAQLSMSVFAFSYPDPVKAFGVPVLTSGHCGFTHVRDILCALSD